MTKRKTTHLSKGSGDAELSDVSDPLLDSFLIFDSFGGVATRPKSLTESAVNIIRDQIINLSLSPGLKIDERLLMERFNLSRTPAREALNRLVAEGLVEIQSNKGAFVKNLGLSDVKPFFEALVASEGMVGAFCNTYQENLLSELKNIESEYELEVDKLSFLQVTRLNSIFHLRIAKATENENVLFFAARMHNQARRVSHFIYKREQRRKDYLLEVMQSFKQEHAAIIDAIEKHDNELLVQRLTDHTKSFHECLIQTVGDLNDIAFDPFTAKLGYT